MKAIRLFFLLLLGCGYVQLQAQVLEVPTLKSKGINGQVNTVEWHSFQAIKDKGNTYVKKDIETYDDQGRLVSVLTENYQNNQSYKTIYTLNKKGLLTQIQIVNPSNNLALRTTSYEYKKGLLIKTSQSQGANTMVKDYSYNKQKQLVAVKVAQNGTLSLEEFYELDTEDRRTKVSRKLPADAAAKVTSTFSYELKDGQLISTENRTTDQGQFVITKTTMAANRRDISEVTKRVSDGQQGVNRQFFEDDEQGNWVKGEVIGDQYSRSQVVLRKFTYTDGTTTGRAQLAFPEDYHAQFIRQYSQKQVAINGKVYNSSTAYDLEYTADRLTYVADLKAWVLLKDYDKNSNMRAWSEAHVLAGGKEEVYWAATSIGIDVFNAGKKVFQGTAKTNYSAYELGDSYAAYIRGDINKPFVAEHAAEQGGKLIKAALTDDYFNWAKVSDSTYVLTNRGQAVIFQSQFEDADGNKLAQGKQGSTYLWYLLPGFRDKFENTAVGDIHPAEPIFDLAMFLKGGRIKADFSSFSYVKYADNRYGLITRDGQKATGIASKTFKTPDDKLVAYYPLTQQYLQMEKYYQLESGKEWKNQKVSIVSDSTAYVYYTYNENKSIVFYTPEGKIDKKAFANHRLIPDKEAFGALVYDSLSKASYAMNYDLDVDSGFGPMRKLPANGHSAYILKLEGGRWVIFEKGIKVQDYTFSKATEEGSVIHFYKGETGKANAMRFRGFVDASVGDFLPSHMLYQEDVDKYLKDLGIDPELKKDQ